MNLLGYQEKAISHLSKWKVGALFMEAGTGKTRVAVELVNNIPDVHLVVWIGPLRTINRNDGTSVRDEIERWGGFRMPVIYRGVESIGQSERIYADLLQQITTFAPENIMVIVDESLKIKNRNAKRTRRLLEIGKKAEYKLILNGTPMSKNLLDIWSQMEFLSPKILNMDYPEFKNTFCDYTTVRRKIGWRTVVKEYITGFENIDYLYSLIRHYVFECNLDLKISQLYTTIHYYLSEDESEEYYRLKDYFLSDEAFMWTENFFLSMTQKMQHSYCCARSKMERLAILFTQIPEEKTIIFCKYVDSQNECRRRFPKAKILSYQKESFGLNLQEYNHTVYFDKIWDLALRVQAGRRTSRTGQEYDCRYYDLKGDVGLEHLIDKNIEKKTSMLEYFKKKTKEDLRKEL